MIEIHARREPTFATAQGTFERWQDLVRMRDASIYEQRFRDEHDRRLAAEQGPFPEDDLTESRRYFIKGLDKELERQAEQARRVGHTMPAIVSVPENLIDDELMRELRRLQQRFPHVTFERDIPRPWYRDIADDAPPELMPEVEDIVVMVPDKSRSVSRPRGGSEDNWTSISVISGDVCWGRAKYQGHLIQDDVFTNTRHDDRTEELFWSAPHSSAAIGLLRPWLFAHGWVERAEPRRPVEVAGREAEVVALDRLIPFSDARTMGDDDNPLYGVQTDEYELVFDREHGVVLETRELFEAEPSVRQFFSSIAFDVPLDPDTFTIPREPDWTS